MSTKTAFTFVLDRATLKAVREYAHLDQVTASEWVRRAVKMQIGTEAAQLERRYVEARQAIENLHASYGVAQ